MFYVWILMMLILLAIIIVGWLVWLNKRRHRPVHHGFEPGAPIDR